MVYKKKPTYEELENTVRILHTENLQLHYKLQTLQASDERSKLDLGAVSDFFPEAAKILKETIMLMALKHLLGEPESDIKLKKREWLERCGKVCEFLENYG